MTTYPDDQNQSSLTLRVIQDYHQAWIEKDVDRIVGFYHQDLEYHDFSLNRVFTIADVKEYVLASIPKNNEESLTHIDRIRVDGHTAFIQYELNIGETHYRSSEALTVFESKIIRIHEYGVIMKHCENRNKVVHRSNSERLGLSARQLAIMANDMDIHNREQQPYLDPNLTLQALAQQTGYTRNQLSYFLNHVLNRTFYQYIHSLRIDALLTKLTANTSPTMIQQLAHEAGFRSQSVFYKQFKLATGLSPKAYINNLLLADTQATK